MRGADLIIKTLAQAGVDKIFSLSGNQIMPLYDACIDAGIEIIHTRHEAAAVYMADAYAQLTGRIGVCLVTAAPGASNALGPIFSARQSESPVLFLTGDSPLSQDGTGAFQELDQVPMSAPLTKLSFRALAANRLGDDIARGIRTALSGRPGPVHIALPFDVVQADVGDVSTPHALAWRPTVASLGPDDMAYICQALQKADRPLVICGPALNATRTGARLLELADAIDAPVVCMESPRGLKDPSLGDFAQTLNAADLIVSLGKPVNFTVAFGRSNPASQWVVVDSEGTERDRAVRNLGAKLSRLVAADAFDALSALTAAGVGGSRRRAWRDQVAAHIAARSYSLDQSVAEKSLKVSPAALVAAVQKQLDAQQETVMISDGGEFGQWSQAGSHGTHRLINGPSGAIGGALCYALAAKKAKPQASVFALMGDGTVGFHFAEFETAAREGTPFVVVIGNDECWNAEHQIQLREYGEQRLIGCQLSAARYDLAVQALGGHGEYVSELSELDAALTRAVNSGKVACVNVAIQGLPAPSGSAH